MRAMRKLQWCAVGRPPYYGVSRDHLWDVPGTAALCKHSLGTWGKGLAPVVACSSSICCTLCHATPPFTARGHMRSVGVVRNKCWKAFSENVAVLMWLARW